MRRRWAFAMIVCSFVVLISGAIVQLPVEPPVENQQQSRVSQGQTVSPIPDVPGRIRSLPFMKPRSVSVALENSADAEQSAIADDAVLPPEDDAPLAAAELLARAAELLVTA